MKPPAEIRILRLRECASISDTNTCDTPERAVEYWRANVATATVFDPDKEHFVVLLLNTRKRVMGHNVVAVGSLDSVIVHPREVFRPAIVAAASALILMHNHPSGDPVASDGDIRVTRDLIRAGQLLRIDVLDSIVVGQPGPHSARGFTSLRESGYFY